jgi:hypothetical protein
VFRYPTFPLLDFAFADLFTARHETMSFVVGKADRIDETLWNHHRPIIERLYVKEQRKLEKDDGVIEYMKKHHGFTARYTHPIISVHTLTGTQ